MDKNQESYSRCIWRTELPEIRIRIMCRQKGVKKEVKHFVHEIGFKIFFQYREMNHHKIKFWKEDTLMASYSRALITLQMC